jgi:hypothetical protein
MKKVIVTFLAILAVHFSFINSGHAQLKRDIRYVRGTIVHVDYQKKSLTVKDSSTSSTIVFDISLARQPDHLTQGQEVFVIAPLDSNKAKSIRIAKR